MAGGSPPPAPASADLDSDGNAHTLIETNVENPNVTGTRIQLGNKSGDRFPVPHANGDVFPTFKWDKNAITAGPFASASHDILTSVLSHQLNSTGGTARVETLFLNKIFFDRFNIEITGFHPQVSPFVAASVENFSSTYWMRLDGANRWGIRFEYVMIGTVISSVTMFAEQVVAGVPSTGAGFPITLPLQGDPFIVRMSLAAGGALALIYFKDAILVGGESIIGQPMGIPSGSVLQCGIESSSSNIGTNGFVALYSEFKVKPALTLFAPDVTFKRQAGAFTTGSFSIPAGEFVSGINLDFSNLDASNNIDKVQILRASDDFVLTEASLAAGNAAFPLISGSSKLLLDADFDNGLAASVTVDYKIKIFLVGDTTTGDGPILEQVPVPITQALPATPVIAIVTPAFGQEIKIARNFEITWNVVDDIDAPNAIDIDIDYSIDGGTTFLFIAAVDGDEGTPSGSTGIFTWQVPNTFTGSIVLRIRATDTSSNVGIDQRTAFLVSQDVVPSDPEPPPVFDPPVCGVDIVCIIEPPADPPPYAGGDPPPPPIFDPPVCGVDITCIITPLPLPWQKRGEGVSKADFPDFFVTTPGVLIPPTTYDATVGEDSFPAEIHTPSVVPLDTTEIFTDPAFRFSLVSNRPVRLL